jgi:hypothetical protein
VGLVVIFCPFISEFDDGQAEAKIVLNTEETTEYIAFI